MSQKDLPVLTTVDAYSPAEIAERVERIAIAKVGMPLHRTLVLAVLAGAFIGFGALFYAVTVTGSALGSGPTRLLGGAAFSLGLILVVVAGAELFTGNNLLAMAWADKRITTGAMARNWIVVFLANFVGAAGLAAVVRASGLLVDGDAGATALAIARGKVELAPLEAFARGVLCNALVCLAVWLSFAARQVSGKILAILFPVAAFVACGFEHSVANMFFLPLAVFHGAPIGPADCLANLVPVTLGNMLGGGGFVALVYWLAYRYGTADKAQ